MGAHRREVRSGIAPAAVLAVAVLAVSSSAVLVQWADISPVSLAFWRTAGGALILAPGARRSPTKPGPGDWRLIVAAGLALAVHFAAWLASLELTSVAASVTLVSTAPIIIGAALVFAGRRPGRSTWLAIALATLGAGVITVTDLITTGDASPASIGSRPLLGNALALVGAVAMAAYLLVGARLRSHLSTSAYASRTYGVAGVALLAVTLVFGLGLTGPDRATWLAIGGMIIGPQLAGHTLLNQLLRRFGAVTVSLSLLIEPIGAALLVFAFFGQVPSLGAWLGGPIVLAAVALRIVDGTEPIVRLRE